MNLVVIMLSQILSLTGAKTTLKRHQTATRLQHESSTTHKTHEQN